MFTIYLSLKYISEAPKYMELIKANINLLY